MSVIRRSASHVSSPYHCLGRRFVVLSYERPIPRCTLHDTVSDAGAVVCYTHRLSQQSPGGTLAYTLWSEPLVGVVEGFLWALLDTNTASGPMIIGSSLAALIVLVGGAFYFRRMEKTSDDVV